MMKIHVEVDFPCSPAEWKIICKLQEMTTTSAIPIKVVAEEPVKAALTKGEEALLDQMAQATHDSGKTPFMDSMEEGSHRVGAPVRDNSVRSLMLRCLKTRGDTHRKDLIEYVKGFRSDLSDKRILAGLYAGAGKDVRREGSTWILVGA